MKCIISIIIILSLSACLFGQEIKMLIDDNQAKISKTTDSIPDGYFFTPERYFFYSGGCPFSNCIINRDLGIPDTVSVKIFILEPEANDTLSIIFDGVMEPGIYNVIVFESEKVRKAMKKGLCTFGVVVKLSAIERHILMSETHFSYNRKFGRIMK